MKDLLNYLKINHRKIALFFTVNLIVALYIFSSLNTIYKEYKIEEQQVVLAYVEHTSKIEALLYGYLAAEKDGLSDTQKDLSFLESKEYIKPIITRYFSNGNRTVRFYGEKELMSVNLIEQEMYSLKYCAWLFNEGKEVLAERFFVRECGAGGINIILIK